MNWCPAGVTEVLQLAAAALRTLRPLLLVLYHMEADAERLPAFPAAIFVERHDSPPGWYQVPDGWS